MTPEAKAREIAERHDIHWDLPTAAWKAAFLEALHFQPLPEWSDKPMTPAHMVKREPNSTIPQTAPTKPNELPEWALREACEELGIAWGYSTYSGSMVDRAVLTVARLLVERGQKVEQWPLSLVAEMLKAGKYHQIVITLDGQGGGEVEGKVNPKVDPDLVLAREMAARHYERDGFQDEPKEFRTGLCDTSDPVQFALRTIKHLRSEGLLKEVG